MMKQITSLQHPLVKHLAKLRHNTDYRYDHHRVVIEGDKVVAEVCRDIPPITLFVVDPEAIPKGVSCPDTYVVTEEIIHKIAGAQTPEGIIAEIPMPPQNPLKKCRSLVILDGVSDPGNLGALLRTAVAFGWEGIFLLEGCCDPYNDKSLRSARGATFRIPIASGHWEQLDKIISENKLTPYVADLHGTLLSKVDGAEAPALILGNEARGVSHDARKRAQAITIPMIGNVESLNVAVAGGIIMNALGVSRRKS
jgi:TrmH family RNA methyltransferase